MLIDPRIGFHPEEFSSPPAAELDALLAQAKAAYDAMTPEQRADMHRQQRRSYIIAEMGFGDDADEAAYRAALFSGDAEALARLDVEAKARMDRAALTLDEMGL